VARWILVLWTGSRLDNLDFDAPPQTELPFAILEQIRAWLSWTSSSRLHPKIYHIKHL
jgi:hypothetical protein